MTLIGTPETNTDVRKKSEMAAYRHKNMLKFIACAESPLGNECLDFNDETSFPYRLVNSPVEVFSAAEFVAVVCVCVFVGVSRSWYFIEYSGLVVANDDFPNSVNIKVIITVMK
mmetsp:Transcript_9379/g.19445  ORF Transcript_9379/g.19445 Transcript_9379/m.19445 type:complete len:114 (-) Transcript_9379:19-360(-)